MTPQLQYGMGGDRPYGLYYEHSGQTPIVSILIAGLGGVLAGIVAAFVYAYAIEYIPFVKLRFLGTLGFGALVGGVTSVIARAGKVRSGPVVLALVGVCTLAAFYFAWVFWINAVVARYGGPSVTTSIGALITSPEHLWDWIQDLNQYGTWSLGSSSSSSRRSSSSSASENVSGTMLTIIWLIEAAGIFTMAFVVAVPMLKAQMFCEKCRRWCGTPITLRRTQPGDPATTQQTLEAHDLTYLASLPPSTGGQFWDIQLHSCPGCRELNGLSIKQTTQAVDKKGKVTGTSSKTIIDKLLIDRAEADYIRAPGSAVAQEQMGMQPAYPVTPPPAVPGYVAPPTTPGRTPPPPLPRRNV